MMQTGAVLHLQDHLMGKQYLGWKAIREKLEEVKKAEADKLEKPPGRDRDRERERDRGDHHRDRDRDRDRERDRGHSSRGDRDRERERKDRGRDGERRDRERSPRCFADTCVAAVLMHAVLLRPDPSCAGWAFASPSLVSVDMYFRKVERMCLSGCLHVLQPLISCPDADMHRQCCSSSHIYVLSLPL